MKKHAKLRETILYGSSDNNIDFNSLCRLLVKLGFEQRVKGSHHIFTKNDVSEIINIQAKGRVAKPYQVKQVRKLLLKYMLGEDL